MPARAETLVISEPEIQFLLEVHTIFKGLSPKGREGFRDMCALTNLEFVLQSQKVTRSHREDDTNQASNKLTIEMIIKRATWGKNYKDGEAAYPAGPKNRCKHICLLKDPWQARKINELAIETMNEIEGIR